MVMNKIIFWQSNKVSWITRELFTVYIIEVFYVSIKSCLEEWKLLLKALLILENATGHDSALAESLEL